ncbi:MAG: hypothetical protein NDJ90_15870 [Oligoflexia bacterium]|nr:hypothetical protein [Oligoflexia bacterium]
MSDVTRAELELLRQKIDELVQKHPDKAAIILAEWLKRPAGERPRKKVA